MLEAHAASGRLQETAVVYGEMKQHGLKPDHCTFIALFMVRSLHLMRSAGTGYTSKIYH